MRAEKRPNNDNKILFKVRKEDRVRGGGGKKVRRSQSGCIGKNDGVVTKVTRTKNYKTIDGRFNALT